MLTRYVRFADLRALRIVDSWPQLNNMVKRDGFPPGIKLGMNTRVWHEADVEAWLATRTNYPAPLRGNAKRLAERKAETAA